MRTAAAILALSLGACASPQITVASDPPGATLYDRGTPMGRAPLYFHPPETCTDFSSLEARWPSGAYAKTGPLWVCPDTGTIWVRRPDGPGREIDEQFALQREYGAAQAQAVRDAAALQAGAALLTTPPVYAPAIRPPVNCRSTSFGNTVNTNCW